MVENRPYRDFFAHAVLITGVLLVAFPLWVTFVASTLTFDQIVTVPKWARRLHRVVRDLPPELATYKGFIRNRDAMVEWLSKYDDGAPTSPGWFPDD